MPSTAVQFTANWTNKSEHLGSDEKGRNLSTHWLYFVGILLPPERERLPATKRWKVIVDWFSMSNSEKYLSYGSLDCFLSFPLRPSSLLCVYATYAKYNRIFSHINALLFSFAELWSVTDDSERGKFSIFPFSLVLMHTQSWIWATSQERGVAEEKSTIRLNLNSNVFKRDGKGRKNTCLPPLK